MKELRKCKYCSVYGSGTICEQCGAPMTFPEEDKTNPRPGSYLIIDEPSEVDWEKLLIGWKI